MVSCATADAAIIVGFPTIVHETMSKIILQVLHKKLHAIITHETMCLVTLYMPSLVNQIL